MKQEIELKNQIIPCRFEDDKELFVIHNKKELIEQLESLKKEATLNLNTFSDLPVFYKDFNALKIAIQLIKEMKNLE